nr:unnamed protein product [Trichobilharzia regenti]
MTTQMNGTKSDVPHFNLTINGIDDYKTIYQLILLLFPEYEQKYIVTKILNNGFSNTLLKIDYNQPDSCTTPSHSQNTTTSFLISIHGDLTSSLIDRSNEIKYMKTVKHLENYRKMYGLFNNGSVYSFIQGCDISSENLSNIKYSSLIAEKLAALHCLPIDEFRSPNELCGEDGDPRIFSRIIQWINRLQDDFINSSRKSQNYESIFPSKAYALNEMYKIKQQYIPNPISKIVLCHNDLNAANIILAPDENSIHLIDMEYCDLNYAAFDIGNHFCEFTGPYALEFDKYPSLEFQKRWMKVYLSAYREYFRSNSNLKHNDNDDELSVYTEDCLEIWLKEVNCFALLSNLLWAIWAVICAAENLTSMDYLA